MKDLSMHIMDIVQNSVRAKASEIKLSVAENGEWLIIRIDDNGIGMDTETLEKVTDPFFTSRTTRKVGMGIPLFKQNAELTGGELSISSELGKGASLTATFRLKHIDRPPKGDLSSTVAMMMTGNPGVDLDFSYTKEGNMYSVSTTEVKEVLGDINIGMPKVTGFLKEMIEDNLKELKIELD